MPSNRAAWLIAKAKKPLEIKSAPYTRPGKNEIVVKNRAVAMNPLDYFMQSVFTELAFTWVSYPCILGGDLAGEVVEVGEGVTRFKVGDRVVGQAVGLDKRSNKPSEGAFQEYIVVRTNLASPIPSSMSYADACVLPLGLSTAACGLFMKDFLALQHPTSKIAPKSANQTLLVWGGSTSVGSNAIQLAVAAGYEVIATASPKNFDYVKGLGASEAFDYRSKTVVKDIIRALENKQCAGAIAIGTGSLPLCMDIVAASKGKKFVAQASANGPDELPTSRLGLIPVVFSFILGNISLWLKSKMKGVDFKFIFGSDLMANEVGAAIYEKYLPTALAEGKYSAAPESQVVGSGLERIQEAMDVLKRGVSAKKVVVTL